MKKEYWFFIVPVVLFAAFMYHVNTSDQEKRLKNPKVGDLYIFQNFLQDENFKDENVFKVSKVTADSVWFYLPMARFILSTRFDDDKMRQVRELDATNEMFAPVSVSLSKKDIFKYKENASLSRTITKSDATRLIKIY